MKKDIHPKYYPNAKIHCLCGAAFTMGATKPELEVEVCSQCHPFFTGKEKIIDVAGHVERFRQRAERSRQIQAAQPAKKPRVKKQSEPKMLGAEEKPEPKKPHTGKPKKAAHR
jgi:large subunit ribosomal protein L31